MIRCPNRRLRRSAHRTPANPTARSVASHPDNGGSQPLVGSVVESGKDTTLSRNTGGSSSRTNDPLRKGLASSASETTTRSTREPSRVVVITGAVGMVDDPRC